MTDTSATTTPDLGRRFAARAIDGGLVWFVTWIPVSVLLVDLLLDAGSDTLGRVVQGFIVGTVTIVYLVAAEVRFGQTVGKRMMGLRVVGESGNPTVSESLRRNCWVLPALGGGVPLLGNVLGLLSLVAILAIAATVSRDKEQGRGWHDRLAGTRVVPTA